MSPAKKRPTLDEQLAPAECCIAWMKDHAERHPSARKRRAKAEETPAS